LNLFYLSGDGRNSLDEVNTHILLQIEVSENITLLKLQKRSKSRVGVDLASVGRILKIVRSDVNIDFSGNISSSHLSSNGLSEEKSKLVTNLSGLHETRRSTVSTLLLSLTLRCSLELLAVLSLNRLEERLHNGKLASDLLKIGVELKALSLNVVGSLGGNLLSLRKGLNRNRNIGSGGSRNNLLRLGLSLLGRLARSLLLNRCRGRGGNRSRGGNCRSRRRNRLGSLGLLGSLL